MALTASQKRFRKVQLEAQRAYEAGEITKEQAWLKIEWAKPTREDALELLLDGAKPSANPGVTRGRVAGRKKAESLFGQLLDGEPPPGT